MERVSLARLRLVHGKMAGRVAYRLGAKAPSLDADTSEVPRIDCSGFVRYAVAKAGGPVMPDGSYCQRDWCAEQGLHKLARYDDVTKADDSRLFIAFIAPRAGRVGHVWLVVRSGASIPVTLESCGSKGVYSRPWNSRALVGADACYELPAEA